MTHTDWDAQRERLSAHVDDALGQDDRAELEAHLPSCAECQRELAALRQTKALLGALPTPALPRSFALPTTPRLLPVRRVAPPAWSGPLQTLGTVAAVVGLGILIWPALPHPATTISGSASYAPVITNGNGASAGPAYVTPAATGTSREGAANADGSPTKSPASVTTASPAPSTPAPTHEPQHSVQEVQAPQPFPTLPVTGGALLVGGAAALAIGGLARRRREDDQLASDPED